MCILPRRSVTRVRHGASADPLPRPRISPGPALRARLALASAVIACASGSPALRAGPPAGLTSIGDLPGGPVASEALGISDNGAFVVGRSYSSSGYEAVLWSEDEGLVGLGDLPGESFYSFAWSVSEDGSVVVGAGSSTLGTEAFRWTAGGGMIGLGDLPGGDAASYAYAVSGDGSIVAGTSWYGFGITAPVLWSEATGLVALTDDAGNPLYGSAQAITPDGTVVAGERGPAGGYLEPFRWTEASGAVGLGFLDGAYFGFAGDISPEGGVVVGSNVYSMGGTEAFRWSQETGLVGLGDLPGGALHSGALGVSRDGTIVVGHATTETGSRAFIWDAAHGMRALDVALAEDFGVDVSGWTLTVAYDVSADGATVVGAGFDSRGNYSGWMARLAVSIASANPPLDNPYAVGPQAFRDVLQNTTAQAVPQGIGAAGTPAAGPVNYSPISVSFSAPPPAPLTSRSLSVNCTDGAGNGSGDCPNIAQVRGSGAGPYEITLTGPIPAGECMTITMPGVMNTLQYQSLPGDVNMNGTVNTQDMLALIQGLNRAANTPDNRARYDINRNGIVNAQDLLRLVQLLNGTNATEPWNGATAFPCP